MSSSTGATAPGTSARAHADGIADSVLDLIGATPMVRLSRVGPQGGAEIAGKMESLNPGGSVKDRIALAMIEAAEEAGLLKPGDTIVEPTSGNTGIGLAMVAAVKGYKLILTMPEDMSVERRRLLTRFGAQLVLTPAIEGMSGAVYAAQELNEKKGGYFMPQQFNNPANPEVHRRTTAREILRQTEGKIDAFVAGVGTGGTITGVGEVLKAVVPGVRIIAVKDDDAFAMTGRLTREEGLLVGVSAGANVFAACQVAKQLGPGKRVVTILCDTGERYLSVSL